MLFTANLAWALQPKEAAALKRVEKGIERLIQDLEKRESGARPADAKFVQQMEKKLSRFKDDLAKLPAEPEVVATGTSLDSLSARLQKLAAQGAQDSSAASALLTSPDYDQDREQFKTLEEIFKKCSRLDAKSFAVGHGRSGFQALSLLEMLKSAPDAEGQLQALSQKWKPVLSSRDGRARFIAIPMQNALKEAQKFDEARTTFRSEGSSQLQGLLQTIESNAVAVSQSKAFERYESQVSNPLSEAEELWKILQVVGGGAPQDLPALERARKQVDAAAQVFIASNKGPRDAFSGAERAQIENLVRQAWKSKYPQQRVLGVRIPAQWSRDTGWKWDSLSKSWRAYDESSVMAYVMLEQSPTLVGWQGQWIHKYHLNGDRLGLQPFALDSPNPRYQMLRKNL